MDKKQAKRIAIYYPAKNIHDNRRAVRLERVAELRGWNVVRRFCDAERYAPSDPKQAKTFRTRAQKNGWTVLEPGEPRRTIQALMECVRQHEIDMVVVWDSLDFPGSISESTAIMQAIDDLGVEIYIHNGRIETFTQAGKRWLKCWSEVFEIKEPTAPIKASIFYQRASMDDVYRARELEFVIEQEGWQIADVWFMDIQDVSRRTMAELVNTVKQSGVDYLAVWYSDDLAFPLTKDTSARDALADASIGVYIHGTGAVRHLESPEALTLAS